MQVSKSVEKFYEPHLGLKVAILVLFLCRHVWYEIKTKCDSPTSRGLCARFYGNTILRILSTNSIAMAGKLGDSILLVPFQRHFCTVYHYHNQHPRNY